MLVFAQTVTYVNGLVNGLYFKIFFNIAIKCSTQLLYTYTH